MDHQKSSHFIHQSIFFGRTREQLWVRDNYIPKIENIWITRIDKFHFTFSKSVRKGQHISRRIYPSVLFVQGSHLPIANYRNGESCFSPHFTVCQCSSGGLRELLFPQWIVWLDVHVDIVHKAIMHLPVKLCESVFGIKSILHAALAGTHLLLPLADNRRFFVKLPFFEFGQNTVSLYFFVKFPDQHVNTLTILGLHVGHKRKNTPPNNLVTEQMPVHMGDMLVTSTIKDQLVTILNFFIPYYSLYHFYHFCQTG